MQYFFNHHGNVPKPVTEAFDKRYTAMRTKCVKYMEGIFNPQYTVNYMKEVARMPITLYWPELCKVEWTTLSNGKYESKVVVAKTKEKMQIGKDTTEVWITDSNFHVLEVRENG